MIEVTKVFSLIRENILTQAFGFYLNIKPFSALRCPVKFIHYNWAKGL